MKRLTLLRHAKSSWADSAAADHDRTLAPRGLRDAPRMGERLARLGVAPDLILTSSAVRARMTAELVGRHLDTGRTETRIDPRVYLASPGELLEILSGVEDGVSELILVGHNPGFTDLAKKLLPDLDLSNLPTAGAVGASCRADRWADISAAPFELWFYEFPKKS